MWTFKKQPPPPPQPKVPVWVLQMITPVILAIVIGLVAFIGSSFSEDIKEIKTQVEKVDEKKVDNETLKLMIQKQEMLIEHQQKEADSQRKQDAEKFDQIQRTQTKTLERIENIAIQVPRGFDVKLATPLPTKVIKQRTIDVLSPDEFERYIKMDSDIRIKYKQYLQSKGKDVSGLPE